MITIEAQVTGEGIALLTNPTLATNTVETAQVVFSFDAEWNGYTKTALFWGTDDEERDSEVLDDAAIIPKEAMAEAGKMKFGVYGIKGDKRLVSAKVSYKIAEGAYVV